MAQPDNSEACFFETRQRLRNTNLPSTLSVAECYIDVCEKLKTLAVTLDRTLSFENHIKSAVRSCNFHIWELRHIRRSLSRDIANTIGCSIVNTRLDNCNSLLHIENKLARVVCDVGNRLDAGSQLNRVQSRDFVFQVAVR